MSQSVSDVGWYEFRRQLEYKGKWYGRTISFVDKYYPSSQICSNCGNNTGKKNLGIREFTCPHCGIHHDRDINASINILNEGLRLYNENKTVGTTGIAWLCLVHWYYRPRTLRL